MIQHLSFYEYFEKYSRVAPLAHSLWRAGEAKQLAHNKEVIASPVLDIGCGFGEFCSIFFSQPVDYGIDINYEDLQTAKRAGCYINLLQADARKIPLKNNSIQTVISISVLEHISNVEKVFPEAYRLLKPQGNLIITVPTQSINNHLLINTLSLGKKMPFLIKIYIKLFHKVFQHKSIYTKHEWIKFIKDAGFTNIKTTPTLSERQLHLFETLLPLALPSQIWKLFFGYRGVVAGHMRSQLLKKMFNSILTERPQGSINLMITAQKP